MREKALIPSTVVGRPTTTTPATTHGLSTAVPARLWSGPQPSRQRSPTTCPQSGPRTLSPKHGCGQVPSHPNQTNHPRPVHIRAQSRDSSLHPKAIVGRSPTGLPTQPPRTCPQSRPGPQHRNPKARLWTGPFHISFSLTARTPSANSATSITSTPPASNNPTPSPSTNVGGSRSANTTRAIPAFIIN